MKRVLIKDGIVYDGLGNPGIKTDVLLADGKVYDQYSLYEGGKAVNPKDPEKSGKSFRYWVKQGEHQKCDVEHLQVEGDLTLEAVFY